MKVSRWIYIIIVLVLLIVLVGMCRKSQIERREQQQFSLQLNQLRSAAKIVLWEQNFTINNITSAENEYLNLFTTKETVHTTINGKMGFDINLADSIHTHIKKANDTIYISAPLNNTYTQLDLGSLRQTKEASLDPSLDVDKNEVIKSLSQKAFDKYMPDVIKEIQTKNLHEQELALQKLTGAPVKIIITTYPNQPKATTN